MIHDSLLRGQSLRFSIDNIIQAEDNRYIVKLIPDIKSKFFPPYHLRRLSVPADLLEESFYLRSSTEKPFPVHSRGTVKQGGYYDVPTSLIRDIGGFGPESRLTVNNDIFQGNLRDSPYQEDIILSKSEIVDVNTLNENNSKGHTYIYCFNVGQGDSILIITSSNSAYLVDTNLYGTQTANIFIRKLGSILRYHGLPENKLKGLIITHKHIDHLRGCKQLLEEDRIQFEYFLINHDYSHPTKPVFDLLESAKSIKKWINVNRPSQITEGKTTICIKNPDINSATKTAAPDINDSSICLCIRHGGNLAFLTGDTGKDLLFNKYKCQNLKHSASILKVSHHGSITGTDSQFLDLLKPTHGFISVGTNRLYNHPDPFVVGILQNQCIDLKISKEVKHTIRYELTGTQIIVKKISE